MKRFFSHDPNGNGFDLHDTAEEAQKEAERCMDAYREDAADSGWDDNVTLVCWGEVRQIAVESLTPAKEGETFHGEPVTDWTHYDLTDTQA